MIPFGEKVKQLREEQNMTQQALADKLYVTRQAISRWERGARYPDLLTAGRLASALNTSLDELLSGESLQDNTATKIPRAYSSSTVIQIVLYALVTIIFAILCIFSLYSYICPNEALLGTPAGEISLIMVCSDILRIVHLFVVAVGLILTIRNKLTPKLIGYILCVPYFTAAFSFIVTYTDILIRQNGSLGFSSWISDFIIPLSMGACILLFFDAKKKRISSLLIYLICILTVGYYLSGYANRFVNFTDLGFVVTTISFIGKIGMTVLLCYHTFILDISSKQ